MKVTILQVAWFVILHWMAFLLFKLTLYVQDTHPDRVGKNELKLNMLRLMKPLVAYGFYGRKSVNSMIVALINIIRTWNHQS